MIIGIFSFLIFLFTIYVFSKDDLLFIRKGIMLNDIFNIILLGLPVVFIFSRIFFIFLHPSLKYINIFVFLAVPYFPGLSMIGAIIGAWLFIRFYTLDKKIPTQRFLDIFGMAFFISLTIGVFLSGIFSFFSDKLIAIEEIGRASLALALFILLILQFLKGSWKEGNIFNASVLFYCILSFISVGFMLLYHKGISVISLVLTIAFFLISLGSFLYKERILKKLVTNH